MTLQHFCFPKLNLLNLNFLLGIGFNVASINLLLTDLCTAVYLKPFVFGSPIAIFWTILCVIMPIFKRDFFSQFSFMPIALYDASFYDGLGHVPNETAVHPFAKPFRNENSIFGNVTLMLIIHVIAASE